MMFKIFFRYSYYIFCACVPPPALAVDMVHVGPGLEQELDAGEVSSPARRPQRRPLLPVMEVDLREGWVR